jgi:hypothetical protein
MGCSPGVQVVRDVAWASNPAVAAAGEVCVVMAAMPRFGSPRQTRPCSIPPNLIECGNNESNSRYIKETKAQGRKVHPARFPAELPRFFIEFLTDPGNLVIDPFAGSNTTGAVAEKLGGQWLAIEQDQGYAEDALHDHMRPTVYHVPQRTHPRRYDLTAASLHSRNHCSLWSGPYVTHMKGMALKNTNAHAE